MKKLFITFLGAIYLIGIGYLVLPSPTYPDLSRSTRSNEPGDTWQHPDQKGFYTDLSRSDVISEMRQKFTVYLFNLPLPQLVLNYPPENAQTLVRDQMKSNYLQEIIYPLRESLIVNGWEPENEPKFVKTGILNGTMLSYEGRPYFSKVSLKPIYSPLIFRLLIWTIIFPATYLTFKSLKSSIYA